jgi:predicted pyridoxine 5'-phosphate oxidase superfamily flavin-nucleotide-binding protein
MIDDSVRQFIQAQPVFFVGSAPLDPNGNVNVSPKGSILSAFWEP